MVAERRTAGVPLSQIGRELEVRPDQLRAWARESRPTTGAGAAPPGETPEHEVRRLRREVAVLRQEQAFAKKVAVRVGAYRAELAAHGMIASMSGTGDCYDNAVAENFFSTLEFELLMQSDWHTREEARHSIFRYIEVWYNRKRRHSTLSYVSPAEYEEQLREAA